MKKILLLLLTLPSLSAIGQEVFHTTTVIPEDGSIYFSHQNFSLDGTRLTLGKEAGGHTLELIPVSESKSGGVHTRKFKVKGKTDEYEIISQDNCYIINWYGEIFRNDPRKYLSYYNEDCVPKKLKKSLRNKRMYLGEAVKW